MRTYLAGPMRGFPQFNFPAFDEAARHLESLGHDVISPADLDRAAGFNPSIDHPNDAFVRGALARDLNAITSCEAVAVLDGWRDSLGASAEVAVARAIPIPVLHWRTLDPITDDAPAQQEFSTGAVRDTLDGKPRLELISPIFISRLGAWLAEGAKKYNDRNWERGIPADRSMGSLLRHINAHREGLTDEDHMAAAACNVMFIIHTEEMVRRGKLPAELANIPHYV